MNIILLRMKNTAKLNKMIKDGENYEKILKQSQKLDKYLVEEMKIREKL